MSLYADDIVKLASELRILLSADEGLAGFSGSIAKKVSGTDSHSFAAKLRQLEGFVALQTAREQATSNLRPPLVDPSQLWACKMLAESVASLDQGQSAEQLLRELAQVNDYYGPDYAYREVVRN